MRRSKADGAARDLDETRRLCYMLLADVDDKRDREAAGTLVNALVHHQQAASDAEALKNVAALLNNRDDPDARQWLLEHVKRINGQLMR